jgi:predicted aconitase
VAGGRTNTEGVSSTGAASLVGRIPYWGYHLDENRRGTHLLEVTSKPQSVMDWGLLGYYVGEIVQEHVPVITGVDTFADLARFKHMGAAAASSGGVEMFHVVGLTPEAPTAEVAFGGNRPLEIAPYGPAQRLAAYENVTSAQDNRIDFVMLGCPHYSLKQVQQAARLLEGREVHPDVSLWIFTAQAIKTVAKRMGYADIIHSAGAVLMTDTCPALGGVRPEGARVAALDSCKQAHYLPPTLGIDAWFGSTEQCIDAAVTGQWRGELV